MIIWGLVSGMTAVVHDFTGLVIVRFFLGLVEAYVTFESPLERS